jgi:hypothetical protein
MEGIRIHKHAGISSLPCLQGRVGVGCERSEWRKDDVAKAHARPAKFNDTLKHKQPHPNPPLLSQGRELFLAFA